MTTRRKVSRRHRPITRDGTKLSILERMLTRKRGATRTEMATAIGWLPLSINAALFGAFRRLGIAVTSEPRPRAERVYRIAG